MELILENNYYLFTLFNGIRVVHKNTGSPVAHLGILINSGSRDEFESEHGLAHFIEHAMFKGTRKRKTYQLISRLEDVGGELNAYTTKEETCVHASFLSEYYERALELISDIVFNPIFPVNEIEKEKEVIIDEINSYRDNPSEMIFDDFEQMIFPDNTLGRTILGTEKSVSSLTREDIINFRLRNYSGQNIVVSSVGNLNIEKIKSLAIKYLLEIEIPNSKKQIFRTTKYIPSEKLVEHDTYQAHCIIGNVAYHVQDSRRLSLFLLNNILGGPGMNSRLNLSLREKNGYTYNIESSYNPYFDTGVFTVYFGTDKEKLDKSIKLSAIEFKKLREKRMGVIQLSKAKKQLKGQIAIASENNESLMLNMGKSIQVFGRMEEISEIYKQIDNISSGQLIEIANEILHPQHLSTLIFK